jgi:hypothetical protein
MTKVIELYSHPTSQSLSCNDIISNLLLLMLAKALRRLNNQSAGLLRPEAALWLELFALSSVVRHEEVFNLVDEVLIQVVERNHVTLVAGVGGNGEQAVIAIGFS